MSNSRIHPEYCCCGHCARQHPAAHEIAPSLKASLLAFAVMGGWAAILWLGQFVAHQLTAIVP